jgi:alpha-L-fucosidase 2
MVLQSHVQAPSPASANSNLQFEIQLLPALPKAWASGSVKGLRARGGFEVDMAWDHGKIVRLTVRSGLGNPCRIRSDASLTMQDSASPPLKSPEAHVIDFDTRAGTTYTLVGK